MTGADSPLQTAAALMTERAGIRPSGATHNRLESALDELASARRIGLSEYVKVLAADKTEFQRLLDTITVQETSFFRDAVHFRLLINNVLPDLKARPTVWSAGCATGQEAYSLAMALDEANVPDWRIVASDISDIAVARTREAVYTDRELRGLTPARRVRYLDKEDGRWRVTRALRDRVTTVHHNLAHDPPPVARGECGVVFCRNVLIYLTPEHVTACLSRMREYMTPAGWLFIGASEALRSAEGHFTLQRLGEGFAYRPVDPKTRSRAAAGPARVIAASGPPPAIGMMRPAPPPPKAKRARPAEPAAPPPPPAELLRRGDVLSREGQHDAAVAQYRKAAYLSPDDPLAHLRLALSLEASGDAVAGRRALLAAKAALRRADPAQLEADLEGYRPDDLEAWLSVKLGAEPCR
jgi:chemotaxis protein methyltransferase CheR